MVFTSKRNPRKTVCDGQTFILVRAGIHEQQKQLTKHQREGINWGRRDKTDFPTVSLASITSLPLLLCCLCLFKKDKMADMTSSILKFQNLWNMSLANIVKIICRKFHQNRPIRLGCRASTHTHTYTHKHTNTQSVKGLYNRNMNF